MKRGSSFSAGTFLERKPKSGRPCIPLITGLSIARILSTACFHAPDAKGRSTSASRNAFRHGCNRGWELSGMNPAVLRQQMGHSSAVMTARNIREIPLEQIWRAFSGAKTGNMEIGRPVREVAELCIITKLENRAGVVQWQYRSFPSFGRGFDSHRPLQKTNCTVRTDALQNVPET